MAILFDPPASPQITVETLAREPLVLIGPELLPPRVRLSDAAARPPVMPAAPNALRQLLEQHARPRGLPLRVVAEVESVQTVLSLVARGSAFTVLPRSALDPWSYSQPPHVAAIFAPTILIGWCWPCRAPAPPHEPHAPHASHKCACANWPVSTTPPSRHGVLVDPDASRDIENGRSGKAW